MSDHHRDGLRVIAIVAAVLCGALLAIAVAVFLMAASHEARQFLGNARDVTVFAVLIGLILWASKHGMRT